jgi:uncharacterized RmlC-like cupin family protein
MTHASVVPLLRPEAVNEEKQDRPMTYHAGSSGAMTTAGQLWMDALLNRTLATSKSTAYRHLYSRYLCQHVRQEEAMRWYGMAWRRDVRVTHCTCACLASKVASSLL